MVVVKASRGGMFYGSLFMMTFLCCSLGTLLIWVALSQFPIDYTMILFALVFLILLVYTIVKFSKNTPIVQLNDEGIRYAGQWYGWGQITSADFIQQKRFPLLGGGKPMKAITLTFDQSKYLCIFDSMYSNGNEMRNYIQSRVQESLHVQPEIDKEELDEATVKKQKRKMNLFIFSFIATLLLLSFLIVFLNLSKGLEIFILILFNILAIVVYAKIFGKRRDVE